MIRLQRGLHILFGKPFKKGDSFLSKYFRFTYWGMIVFYFFSLSILGLGSYFNSNSITSLIIWAIFLPTVFRLTYSLVGKLNGLEKDA